MYSLYTEQNVYANITRRALSFSKQMYFLQVNVNPLNRSDQCRQGNQERDKAQNLEPYPASTEPLDFVLGDIHR